MSIGLCEEMGFQPSSKLSTTNGWWAEMWWKRVPDGLDCNMDTFSAKLCFCQRDKHVVVFCRTYLPDQKCRRLGCRRCWSRQDSAHRHSQTQRLLSWTVFAVALGANEARREGPAWCVHICQHWQPDGRQRSGPSEVDGWLVKRDRTEHCCSNQLDWRWETQSNKFPVDFQDTF